MKKLSKILLILLCGAILVGCGAATLSDNYSEESLKNASEKLIMDISNEKYEEVYSNLSEKMKSSISEEKLKEVWSSSKGDRGSYKSMNKIAFQEKEGIAVVVILAEYEKSKVQFTISFNKEMEVEGFYFK